MLVSEQIRRIAYSLAAKRARKGLFNPAEYGLDLMAVAEGSLSLIWIRWAREGNRLIALWESDMPDKLDLTREEILAVGLAVRHYIAQERSQGKPIVGEVVDARIQRDDMDYFYGQFGEVLGKLVGDLQELISKNGIPLKAALSTLGVRRKGWKVALFKELALVNPGLASSIAKAEQSKEAAKKARYRSRVKARSIEAQTQLDTVMVVPSWT